MRLLPFGRADAAYSIQRISGNEVKIQIQPVDNKWTESQENLLRKEMVKFLGDGCNLVIEYVDGFESLNNGKRRFFYNG